MKDEEGKTKRKQHYSDRQQNNLIRIMDCVGIVFGTTFTQVLSLRKNLRHEGRLFIFYSQWPCSIPETGESSSLLSKVKCSNNPVNVFALK